MWTSTTGGSYHGIGPWVDAYRTADGAIVYNRGYTYNPDTSSFNVDIPSVVYPNALNDEWKKFLKSELKEEGRDVSVQYKDTPESDVKAVVCYDNEDLSAAHILHTLSALKGKLMMAVAPYRVKSLECSITPTVKANIIAAGKKLKMYGKDMPLVVHFDEWGNILSNEIIIGDSSGINLKIVDPEDVGEFYFELRAKVTRDIPSFYDTHDSFGVPF